MTDSSTSTAKRPRDEEESSDFGPMPEGEAAGSENPPQKRARVKTLRFEKFYIDSLPCAEMYEKSFMHRDVVTHSVVTSTGYVLTGSVDGHVKFWKKQPVGIEFVKHYFAHLAPLVALESSPDGLYAASVSLDRTLKVYDVINFDMITILELGFAPTSACWIYKNQASKPLIAVSSADDSDIRIYDVTITAKEEQGTNIPLEVLKGIHKAPVIVMRYNVVADAVISIDKKGMIEYWNAAVNLNEIVDEKGIIKQDETASDRHKFPYDQVDFEFKSATDLYEFAKTKTVPFSLTISDDGLFFACMGSDRFVRVFKFKTGKLYRKIDETLPFYVNLQKTEDSPFKLDSVDFGRRQAVEKQVERGWQEGDSKVPKCNIVFDLSGHFILYSSLLGVKMVNLFTNKLTRILGRVETTERFLHLSLYQGRTKGSATEGTLVANAEADPTLFCAAYNKQRFYMFTRREPEEADGDIGRDVFNEKPTILDASVQPKKKKVVKKHAKFATIHTTMGDIKIKLHGDLTPKTVENFTIHAKNNYYNSTIIHRVIRSFMIQMGDPLGDGTGGTSIWGKPFADEIHPSLKHEPFVVSMANAGPNTNGSQFFITTVPCPHLDGKHTIFGKVVKGQDIVQEIEKVNVSKRFNKPLEDIRIINIDLEF